MGHSSNVEVNQTRGSGNAGILVDVTEPGALVVRPGFLQFSTQTLGAGQIQGGARVYINTAIPSANSTAFTLVGYDGKIFLQTDAGGWSSTSAQLFSTSAVLSFPSDRDLVAVMDGSTAWKSTNGSSWTHFGIAAGTVAPTVSTLSSGAITTGTFEFSYSYKDRDLATESNGASAQGSVVIAGTTAAISVVVPNSTDPQVDAIIVYARKTSAGETIRRKASSQAQSAGANSTIILTSSAWTTNDEEPSDHDVPGKLSFGVVWKNRWWARDATVTNRLHFTQLFQPQSWPALFYVDIPFERGDAIQALVPLGDTLLIFGTTKIFVVIGQTSLDFEVRPTLASQDGALGTRAVTAIENGVVHAAASGVYIFDGSTDKLLSFDLEPAWRDLVVGATADQLARISVVYHLPRKELRIAVPRRFPTTTYGEWVMDLNQTRRSQQPAWLATDRNIAGYIAFDGPEVVTGNRGRLLAWSSTSAVLFEEATGTTANSSDMTAEYKGAGLSLGPFRGRWVDLRGDYEPNTGAFSAEVEIDGVSQGTMAIPTGAGVAIYGVALYGDAAYAGASRKQWFKMLPLSAEGRTFVLKLTYSGKHAFKWYSYHPGLVPESRSRNFTE